MWLCLVTGQRRLEMQREIAENHAAHRRAMKKYRAWRKSIYERSLAAIRLLDLDYLPVVAHPYRPGEHTYDIELPLRTRNGDEAFCGRASTLEELEEVIRHWFAALTFPTRAKDSSEHAHLHDEGEAEERITVADQYVRKIFHEDLPYEQRDALLTAIFQCGWFDIAPSRLRAYFQRVMRNAASRRYRVAPIKLGGENVMSLDEPLLDSPDRVLGDTVSDSSEDSHQGTENIERSWQTLREFSASIPPSQPKLRRMAALLLELRDDEEAIRSYGPGGLPQLKRLKLELRAWLSRRRKAAS